jgi:Domain of unknown function (DUF4357)
MSIYFRPTESSTLSINLWDEGEIESGLESRKISNGGNGVDDIFKSDDLSNDLIKRIDFFNPCGDQYRQYLSSFASEDSVNIVKKKIEMNEVTYIVDFVDRFGKNIEFSSGVDDLDEINLPPSKKLKISPPLNNQNIFQTTHDVSSSAEEIGEKYIIDDDQIYAIGYLLSEKRMRVKEGSTASLYEVSSIKKCYVLCRNTLVQNHVLILTADGKYRFTADFVFKSPTCAASVIRGKNSSGTICWKNEAGLSISKKKYQRTRKVK